MRRGTALTFVGDAFMQGSNPRASSLCTAGGAANHFTQNSKGTAAAFKPCGGGQREPQSGCEFVADECFWFWPFGPFPLQLGGCAIVRLVPCFCVCVCVCRVWGGGCDSASLWTLLCGLWRRARFPALPPQFKKMTCNEQNRTQ